MNVSTRNDFEPTNLYNHYDSEWDFIAFFVDKFNMTCGNTGECDVVTELSKSLINAGIKLGRGIATLVEALLRVSMLRPSQEQTMPQPTRPRVSRLRKLVSVVMARFTRTTGICKIFISKDSTIHDIIMHELATHV